MNHKKVLLIGCDLRRPTLHRIFNVNNEYGITSYLIGFKKLEEIILPTDIENLFIIPSGPVPPNPAELIDTKEMKDLFTQLKKDFDYLVIDTPPLALVADALSLASYTDITLYIVRQNHSHKQVLEVANAMEKEERLPQLFLLINDLHKSRSMGYDYYYGYGRGYSYDYEYNNYFSPDNSKD
jgi:capsular exopolysaccharide synthesis family protein